MKKLLLSLFILSAAGTYAQEIRMPEEKRKEYVKEQESKKATTSQRDTETDEERKRRALEERKKAAMMNEQSTSGSKIFCIIQEMRSMGENDTRVSVITDREFELSVKQAGEKNRLALGLALEKKKYTSALQALNNFSKNGWELINTTVYTEKSFVIHEYLVGAPMK